MIFFGNQYTFLSNFLVVNNTVSNKTTNFLKFESNFECFSANFSLSENIDGTTSIFEFQIINSILILVNFLYIYNNTNVTLQNFNISQNQLESLFN